MIIALENNDNTVYVNTDHVIKASIIDSGDGKPYFLIICSDEEIERFYNDDAVSAEIAFSQIAEYHWDAIARARGVTQSHASDAPAPAPVDTAENPERT